MHSREEHLDVLLTGPRSRVPVPVWIRPYSPKTVAGDDVERLHSLPDLTVVEAEGPGAVLRREGFLSSLAKQHSRTPHPSMILFVFKAGKLDPDAKTLSDVLAFFQRFTDVEFARGAKQAEFAVQQVQAKLRLSRSRAARLRTRPNPLGHLEREISATSDLRATSGRLSAQRVAKVFGLSVAELAKLLGRSRQAVSKTDDAESIQPGLAPFARCARLLAVLPSEDFRAWLHLPNEQLEGQTPSAIIREGGVETVAELAEDMLSGSPA